MFDAQKGTSFKIQNEIIQIQNAIAFIPKFKIIYYNLNI